MGTSRLVGTGAALLLLAACSSPGSGKAASGPAEPAASLGAESSAPAEASAPEATATHRTAVMPSAQARRTTTPRPVPTTTLRAAPSRQPAASAAPHRTPAPVRSSSAAASGVVHGIEMTAGFMFSPSSLTIAVGDSVRVHNADSAHHTFTDSPTFDSGDVAPGASYAYRFLHAGTFNFVCSYHQAENMKGSITVR